MNTARCQATSSTPAFLTFGRELRSPGEVHRDLRSIILNENFVPEVTPKLLQLEDALKTAHEVQELEQDRRNKYANEKRRPVPNLVPRTLIWVNTKLLSKKAYGFSSKLAPRRDDPYVI